MDSGSTNFVIVIAKFFNHVMSASQKTHRLHSYIDGSLTIPPRMLTTDDGVFVENPEFIQYEHASLHNQLIGSSSSIFELWQTLTRIFGTHSATKAMCYRFLLHNFKNNDLSPNPSIPNAQNTQSFDLVPYLSPGNTHHMVTRSKAGIFKLKVYIVYTASISSIEPTTIQEPMVIPLWKDVVHDKLQALIRNNTGDLVPLPPNCSLVGCKWLFKTKKNPNGSVARNKVRLVAQGFSQTTGMDYHKTFSPVVKANMVRTLFALVVSSKWKIRLNKHKLQIDLLYAHSEAMLQNYRRYKCVDKTGRGYISRHVQFDEGVFPYAKLSLVPSVTNSDASESFSTLPVIIIPPLSFTNSNAFGDNDLSLNPSIPDAQNMQSSNLVPHLSSSNTHHMVTRRKVGIFKPKVYTTYTASIISIKPTTIQEPMVIPSWKDVVHDELQALIQNSTWHLVPLPSNCSLVGYKWLFKTKKNPDGSVARNKIRLVTQGLSQTVSIDYHRTFSLVVKANTLNKALYSLKQALRAWFQKLHNSLVQRLHFKSFRVDSSLFFKETSYEGNVFLLVYVDDIIITGDSDPEIEKVVQSLYSQFFLKDFGPLSYFLGLEVTKHGDSMYISQQKYAQELLDKADIGNAKPISTPMVSSPTLSFHVGSPLHDGTKYRKIVREAEYRSLANATTKITWFQSLLNEIGMPLQRAPVVWCDNSSIVSLATNLVLHVRVKHVEPDIHFVRYKVLDGRLQVNYVLGHDQVADILTKSLTAKSFSKF
ncbi:hypothetical protein CXB51_009596 [Gossypium anomalum]|uniref:Reverse transcriptase Ty1/copia-type domain-containing protein n=1 Tax=Gossypium anomalum TaxID=47600 RepID=A0A8J5Z1E4_9ROSI|nr:hypothetical protein CXB51_009596 [Gossypium anomalum]